MNQMIKSSAFAGDYGHARGGRRKEQRSYGGFRLCKLSGG